MDNFEVVEKQQWKKLRGKEIISGIDLVHDLTSVGDMRGLWQRIDRFASRAVGALVRTGSMQWQRVK